jgi:hypothetical protein
MLSNDDPTHTQFLHRTPAVRDRPGLVRALDQWMLLAIVLGGQDGGRGDLWTCGFKKVNLHPHHKVPIQVWLSRIADKLIASGGTESSIEDPYGPNYLKLILTPEFFLGLEHGDRLELLGLTSHENGFLWSPEEVELLPPKYLPVLLKADNLWNFYK